MRAEEEEAGGGERVSRLSDVGDFSPDSPFVGRPPCFVCGGHHERGGLGEGGTYIYASCGLLRGTPSRSPVDPLPP